MLIAREVEDESTKADVVKEAIAKLSESMTTHINSKFDEIMKLFKKE